MKTNPRTLRNLEKRRGVFLRIGLMISLLITFLAFEWRTPVAREPIDPVSAWDYVEEEMMPVTRQVVKAERPPAKPEIRKFRNEPVPPVIIDDDEEPFVPVDSSVIDDIIPIDRPVDSDTADDGTGFIRIPEVMPEFPGGDKALVEYLEESIRYPARAVREGLSGTVYINFVINENGEPVNLSCRYTTHQLFLDEAMRVIKSMPRWKPGKQGGVNVPVSMTIPVSFRLIE